MLNAATWRPFTAGGRWQRDSSLYGHSVFRAVHAAASTLFAGLLWWIAWSAGARQSRGLVTLACGAAWVLLVCLSRMYFGLNFPTDIIAGVAESLLWREPLDHHG